MAGNLFVKGKDHAIEVVRNGVLLGVIDAVTRFSADPTYDTMETKVLGVTGQVIDRVPTGWSGEIEAKAKGPEVEDLLDEYNAALNARIPIVINITESVTFTDGTRRRYVYPCVQLEIGKTVQRSETTTYRMAWVTGKERLSA